MSEEQLTVAELLARSGTSPSGSGSRRRRRRSLEEGGISVAELTGSIPRVTEKPEDARHTTSPIDSIVDKDEKPEAKKAEKKADAGTKSAAEQQPKAEKAEAAKDKKASDDSQVKKPAESTKAKKTSEPQTASEEKTSEKAEAARESRDDDTMVLRVFTDGESAPLTTGSFPAVPAQGKQGEQASPAITATTAPKSTKSEDTEQSSDKADATSVLPKVVVDDEDEPEHTATKVQQAETSQDIPQDATEEDNFFPEEDEDADDLVDDAEEEYDEDEKPSIAGIVVTAVVAFIIGVLVFYAFMSLWASSVMPLIVIIAALVVTVAIGVAVHSLKTGKDTLTTVLATVTGLVLTFGPALVTGL